MIMNKKSETIYGQMQSVLNLNEGDPLTVEVFRNYGIKSLKDLHHYIKKHGEYGGAVRLSESEGVIILPFHNDFMNKWLKFNNDSVKAAYDRIYQLYQLQYPDRREFERKRFMIEEDILVKYWKMPSMDTRILAAPINGCWDRMEIFATYLNGLGYEVRRLCCHDGNIMRGHTYIVYKTGTYWTTCLGYPINFHYKDFDSVCKISFSLLRRLPIFSNPDCCELIEFQQPRAGMSTLEYLDLIKNGNIVIGKKKIK